MTLGLETPFLHMEANANQIAESLIDGPRLVL
jgi:hypothetical protein